MKFSEASFCLLFVGIAFECSEDSSFDQSLAGAFIDNGSCIECRAAEKTRRSHLEDDPFSASISRTSKLIQYSDPLELSTW